MSIDPQFDKERAESIAALKEDSLARDLSIDWINRTAAHKYTYGFDWMGLPIIQFPQDIVAMQQIIWSIKPDLIIETGVARGGSIVFYASMMQLLGGKRHVVGVDIEIRPHNRQALEQHQMRGGFTLIEGPSTSSQVMDQVRSIAKDYKNILVCLDSNHTHEHVLEEMRCYSPLVSKGSYMVVFDTVVEYMPDEAFPDRPWGVGNNPMTAVRQFLSESDRFAVDADMDARLLISVAPSGYLRCVQD